MKFRSVLLFIACFAGLVFAQGSGLLGAFGQTIPSTTTTEPSTSLPMQSAPTTASTTATPPTTASLVAAPAASTTTTTAAPTTTTAPAVPEPAPTVVVRATGTKLPVYSQAGDSDPRVLLTGKTEFGTSRVLVATAQRGDWWQVLLPLRPNGSQGWVRGSDVTVDHIADAIFVDISARTLTWARGSKVLLKTTVGVGSAVSPTPKGYFFVTDVLPYNAKSDYGAWVLALNGHSDTFTEFHGGDARIAIHGTNDLASIGQAASFGCVRVPADPLAKLAVGVPIGTPVLIEEHAA